MVTLSEHVRSEMAYLRRAMRGKDAPIPGSPACALSRQWRGVRVGGHRPVIVVPTSSAKSSQLLRETEAALMNGADAVELRLDYLSLFFTGVADSLFRRPSGARDVAMHISEEIEESVNYLARTSIPVLLTVRTACEGGEARLHDDVYGQLLLDLLDVLAAHPTASTVINAIDVEMKRGCLPAVAARARDMGIDVVGSYHDFSRSLDADEIVSLMRGMQRGGAAVAKVALTPENASRTIELMRAMAWWRQHTDVPGVVIGMGRHGDLTRLLGGVCGSALAFARLPARSGTAPGQFTVEQTRDALREIVWMQEEEAGSDSAF